MAPERSFYLTRELLGLLALSRSQFKKLHAAGRLPFLEELHPRIGRPRYRRDLVDRYLAGRWGQPQAFRRRA
jgi:hypothetical protein